MQSAEPGDLVLVRAWGTSAQVSFAGYRWPAVVGRGGVVEAKQEGDGGTPPGRMGIRRVWVRPEIQDLVHTACSVKVIREEDVWCDDVTSSWYNRASSHEELAGAHYEHLWREDHLYDILVELEYNMFPVVAGKGSGIFLHVARDVHDPGRTPTEGCIAMLRADLIQLVGLISVGAVLEVRAGPALES